MATVWVNGELNRIAFEMLACDAEAYILVVETGTLVVLQARCRTLQACSGISADGVRFIQSTEDRSYGSVAKNSVISLSHDAYTYLTLYQPQTGKNQHCDFTEVKHRFTFQLWNCDFKMTYRCIESYSK